jgi:hypothetical protein
MFELRNLMIGSLVFSLTFVVGWWLGVGSMGPSTGKPAQAQGSLIPGGASRP